MSRFHFALRDGGYLVLGKAEMLLNFAGVFEPVDMKRRAFRRVPGVVLNRELLHGYPAAREQRPAVIAMSNRLREISFDQDPIAQLVVDAQGTVLLANIRALELFGLTSRDIGRPLQDLEVSYRPVELRSCIDDAHVRRQSVQVRDVSWPTASGDARFFNVQLTPIVDGSDTPLGTKGLFVDVTRQHELQDELQRSRQDLEAAYEELQSTYEELEALNQELRQRGVELTRSNVFLGGILRSVPLGVIVMTDEFLVELWNDVASDMWGLRQDEVKGKHFLGLDIGLPVQQLREPLLRLRHAPDSASETMVQATNRRGRPITVRVVCASVSGTALDGHGAILLMQESEPG